MIFELIKGKPELSVRTPEEIGKNLSGFVVFDNRGVVVACASLEQYTPRIAEVRSVCVEKRYRNHGVGSSVVETVVGMAGSGQKIFVITRNPEFFERLGFKHCIGEQHILFRRKD